jgi:hypothetical protein
MNLSYDGIKIDISKISGFIFKKEESKDTSMLAELLFRNTVVLDISSHWPNAQPPN